MQGQHTLVKHTGLPGLLFEMGPVSSPSVETTHGLAPYSGTLMFNWQVNVNLVILWSVDRYSIRPVLKHGPRSLTCMQADQS